MFFYPHANLVSFTYCRIAHSSSTSGFHPFYKHHSFLQVFIFLRPHSTTFAITFSSDCKFAIDKQGGRSLQTHCISMTDRGQSSRAEASNASGDDWSNITDPAERRKIQNKLAQRKFRKYSDHFNLSKLQSSRHANRAN